MIDGFKKAYADMMERHEEREERRLLVWLQWRGLVEGRKPWAWAKLPGLAPIPNKGRLLVNFEQRGIAFGFPSSCPDGITSVVLRVGWGVLEGEE